MKTGKSVFLLILLSLGFASCLTQFTKVSPNWSIVGKYHERVFIHPPEVITAISKNNDEGINKSALAMSESDLVRRLLDETLQKMVSAQKKKLQVTIIDRWETNKLLKTEGWLSDTAYQKPLLKTLAEKLLMQAALQVKVEKNCLFSHLQPSESWYSLAFADWLQNLTTEHQQVRPWPDIKVYTIKTSVELKDVVSGETVWRGAISDQAGWDIPPPKMLEKQLQTLLKEFPYWKK